MKVSPGRFGGSAWLDYKIRVKAALPLPETIRHVAGSKFEPAGRGFKACCPFHSEKTPSFFVSAESNTYRCFGSGCGAKGDVFSFLQDWYGISFSQSLQRASELAGIDPPTNAGPRNRLSGARQDSNRPRPSGPPVDPEPRKRHPTAAALPPIPAFADTPKPGLPMIVFDPERKRRYSIAPSMVHAYRQPGGEARLFVMRVDKADGGKFFIQAGDPARNSSGGTEWRLIRFPGNSLRPLYGLEDLPAWEASGSGRILLVEGEKTRDAASRLLPLKDTGILSLSNFGGGSSGSYADWEPVVAAAKRLSISGSRIDVRIWPDADTPIRRADGSTVDRQDRFAQSLASSFLRFVNEFGGIPGRLRISKVAIPGNPTPGWDLADAEKQDWTPQQTLDALNKFESIALRNLNTARTEASKDRGNAAPDAVHAGNPTPKAEEKYDRLEI